MHETFLTLLRDPAHWEFELFLMLVFDVLIAGIVWPFVRRHWRHHVERDERDFRVNKKTARVICISQYPGILRR